MEQSLHAGSLWGLCPAVPCPRMFGSRNVTAPSAHLASLSTYSPKASRAPAVSKLCPGACNLPVSPEHCIMHVLIQWLSPGKTRLCPMGSTAGSAPKSPLGCCRVTARQVRVPGVQRLEKWDVLETPPMESPLGCSGVAVLARNQSPWGHEGFPGLSLGLFSPVLLSQC